MERHCHIKTGESGYEPEIFSKQGMDIAAKTFIIMTHIPDLTLVEHLTGFPLSWPYSGKACRRTNTLAYIRPIFKLQRKKVF